MKIGFVGFGNMASAMADGWIAAGVAASDMCACAGRYDALVERCEARGMVACHDAAEVVAASDIVVAAVKPYMIEKVFAPLKDALAKRSFCRLPGLGTVPSGSRSCRASRMSRRCPTHRFRWARASSLARRLPRLVMSRAQWCLICLASSVRWSSSIRAYCLWAARWVVALRHLSLWQSRPWAMRRSGTVSRVPMPIAL